MGAIFRREFKSYFTSPIAYIQIAIIAFFGGFAFWQIADARYSLISYVFQSVFSFAIMVLPITTMRLFSEDKRQKTDQLLFTSPVSLTAITFGKFLAAYLLFLISLGIFVVFALIIAIQVPLDWAMFIANMLGMLLIGGLIIAIGLLVSSLTESQLIAAVGTLCIVFILLMINSLSSTLSGMPWAVAIINFLSISTRYSNFTSGLIKYNDIVYFLSLQALFIFLTIRLLDRKRWS